MGNFIEQSAEDIILNSMANVFMHEALDPVGKEDDDIDNDGDVDKSDGYLKKRRKTVGAAIAADKAKRVKKEELELHLRTKVGELAEKKLYKSEKATNSDEKEITIEEKPVKNTVVINPDVNEGLINTIKNFYEVVGDTRSRSNKSPVKTGATPSSSSSSSSKSGPITDRERIARIDTGKDPYPLKSQDAKLRLSLGIKDIDMGTSPVRDGHAKFMKSLGMPVGGSTETKGVAGPKDKKQDGTAKPKAGAKATASAPTQGTKGEAGPEAKKLSTVDTGSSEGNVKDTIADIKKKIQKEQATDYRASMAADAAAARAQIRTRAQQNYQRLQNQPGGVKGAFDKLRTQAGVDYENQPDMVKTAPGIFRSKSAIEADKPLTQRLGELPSAQKRAQVDAAKTKKMMSAPMRQESTIEDDLRMVLERTRYAKEKGKDFKTGKDSKKGGTRDGKSAFDKVSANLRKTGGVMSSRGKAIQPQGKKKKKGEKGYKGNTPVDKIKGELSRKRAPKKDPYNSRFD